MKPIVSVVMPVLNTASYLPEAIDSILGQTFGDLELIVVDDGSSDSSREIAAEYARRDPRLRQIVLQRDAAGLSGARAANAGIAIAEGEYIARMDSDDIAMPGRLAAQLAHMSARGLDVCGGQSVTFGERERVLWHPQSRAGIRNELVFSSATINPTLVVRAELMREARYSEKDAFEQYEFQTRIFFRGRMENTGEIVHRFREHPQSATRVFRSQKAASNWQLRFRYFFRLFPNATLDDFRAVHKVARMIPIDDPKQLETAGHWLWRLSRVEEHKVRERMLRRWRETCDAAVTPPEVTRRLEEDVADLIAGFP
jgi:glycosyltransferase involved in cell wall biosynthesis